MKQKAFRKICENPECKKEFRPRTASQRFCSNKCKSYMKRKLIVELQCPSCEKMFLPTTTKQKFCSASCSKLAIRSDVKIFSYLRDNNIL